MKKTLKQKLTGMKPTTECHVQFDDMRFCGTVSELLKYERVQRHKDNLVTGVHRQHVAGRHYVEIYVGRGK